MASTPEERKRAEARGGALAGTVHRSLLEALRTGVYGAGDRLREEEVAARLGVSRTPVREALGRLIAGNLVESSGGRGLVVRRLDTTEILELYAMRELLEGAAAGLAARHLVAAEFDALADLQHRLRAPDAEPAELARLNRLFHAALVRAARNRYLSNALASLQDVIAILGPTTLGQKGRANEAGDEHDAILAAVRNGDPEAAQEAARRHIRSALRSRLAMLDR